MPYPFETTPTPLADLQDDPLNMSLNLTTASPTATTSAIHEGTGSMDEMGEQGQPPVYIPHSRDDITLSKLVFIPSLLLLLLTSTLLLYLILKHFRHLLHLYYSLIFYTLTQFLLLAVLLASSLLQTQVDVREWCGPLGAVQNTATILPGYGILLVTLARWMCVRFPVSYKKLLDLKLQTLLMGLVLVAVGVVCCVPLMGMETCRFGWTRKHRLRSKGYCDLAGCEVYRWVLLVLGYILPFVGVVLCYCVVVRCLVEHKRLETRLGKCKGISVKKIKVDYKYKPVTVAQKLAQLRKIGQDAIPWSIVVILVLNTVATVPWIPQIFILDKYYAKPVFDFMFLDLSYTVLLVAAGLSPAAYFLTTPAMKTKLVEMIKQSKVHKLSQRFSRTSVSKDITVSSRVP